MAVDYEKIMRLWAAHLLECEGGTYLVGLYETWPAPRPDISDEERAFLRKLDEETIEPAEEEETGRPLSHEQIQFLRGILL